MPMTAIPPSQITYRPRETTKSIIFHDTHTSPYQSGIHHFLARKGREVGLLEIGYHYLVLPDGKPLAVRPHNVVGSHCRGYNRESIGVALVGGMDYPRLIESDPLKAAFDDRAMVPYDTFTQDQVDGAVFLCRYLMENMGYGELDVVAHTELPRYADRKSPCPYLDMDRIRRAL